MHYPEMVKTNHRYRGPMESVKMNNTIRDIEASLQVLRGKFSSTRSKATSIHKSVSTSFKKSRLESVKPIQDQLQAMLGGEG